MNSTTPNTCKELIADLSRRPKPTVFTAEADQRVRSVVVDPSTTYEDRRELGALLKRLFADNDISSAWAMRAWCRGERDQNAWNSFPVDPSDSERLKTIEGQVENLLVLLSELVPKVTEVEIKQNFTAGRGADEILNELTSQISKTQLGKELQAEIQAYDAKSNRMSDAEWQELVDKVYSERNHLAIALARLALQNGYAAGYGFDPKNGRAVVYVDLSPTEQVSWHMDDAFTKRFKRSTEEMLPLPKHDGRDWDGTYLAREPWWYTRIPMSRDEHEESELDQREADSRAFADHVKGMSIQSAIIGEVPATRQVTIHAEAGSNVHLSIYNESSQKPTEE